MDLTAIDLGLLLLRLGVAFILLAHATQKILGWFGGAGVTASAALFETLGQRPGRPMVYLAAACELAAAVSLLGGFLTPLGAAIGVGTMVVAGDSLNRLKGTFWNALGGGEYPYFIALVVASLAFLGPGAASVDAFLGTPWLDRPVGWGVLALGVGLVASIPPLVRSRRAPAPVT